MRENHSTNLSNKSYLSRAPDCLRCRIDAPIMYVYCDDCSNGSSNPRGVDGSSGTGIIGRSAEPDGAGADSGDNGGR
jgi:hypothetical protein